MQASKIEKNKNKKIAVLRSPIWGDPIFILKKYIKPYKLAFFSWCKISRYCKIWNGLSTFWKVLGIFFKKITRISKEIELSSPCRAREPKYSGFFFGSSHSIQVRQVCQLRWRSTNFWSRCCWIYHVLNVFFGFLEGKKTWYFLRRSLGWEQYYYYYFFNFVMGPHQQPSSRRIPPTLAIG